MTIKMKIVEPIRSKTKINQIKKKLESEWKIRDLLLFTLGINSALRISDMLGIQIKDLYHEDGQIRDFFYIKEDKTKKTNKVTITSKVKEVIKIYTEQYPSVVSKPSSFVFFHQKIHPLGSKHIDRRTSYVLINKRCRKAGLDKEAYGNHTLRKTWGYQARMVGITLPVIQEKLKHSSLSITRKYLGINDEEVEEACNRVDL